MNRDRSITIELGKDRWGHRFTAIWERHYQGYWSWTIRQHAVNQQEGPGVWICDLTDEMLATLVKCPVARDAALRELPLP